MRLLMLFPLGKGFRGGIDLNIGEGVEQAQPGRRVERQQRFVLSVNGGEIRRQLAQHGDGRGLVVDENPSLAARRNLAAQDDRFVFLVGSMPLFSRI